MATLKELRNEKAAKSNELADIFDSVEQMSELTSDQKEEKDLKALVQLPDLPQSWITNKTGIAKRGPKQLSSWVGNLGFGT